VYADVRPLIVRVPWSWPTFCSQPLEPGTLVASRMSCPTPTPHFIVCLAHAGEQQAAMPHHKRAHVCLTCTTYRSAGCVAALNIRHAGGLTYALPSGSHRAYSIALPMPACSTSHRHTISVYTCACPAPLTALLGAWQPSTSGTVVASQVSCPQAHTVLKQQCDPCRGAARPTAAMYSCTHMPGVRPVRLCGVCANSSKSGPLVASQVSCPQARTVLT
jgi:hypothetical protein